MRQLAILLILCLLPLPCLGATPQLLGVLRGDSTHVLFGQSIIPVGDQNGDGCSEILVYNGYNQNYLYFGGRALDSAPDLKFDKTGGLNGRLIGDANADGYGDFTLIGGDGIHFRLNLYYGGPLLDTIPDRRFGVDTLYPIGPAYLGNDLNRDGSDELISAEHNWWSVVIYELNKHDSLPSTIIRPVNLPLSQFAAFGSGLAVGDFNGDGVKDIAASLTQKSTTEKAGEVRLYFGGQDFDTLPDLVLPRPGPYVFRAQEFGSVVENVGDLNGDGYDDLFVGSGRDLDSVNYVWFGGPSLTAQPNLTIPTWLIHVHPAGDINRDGYQDIIGSTPTSVSGAGWVYVFYGGPHMTGQWDIRIANWDFPGYHDYFGMNCAGIGDFNGDGVDDFAFSLLDAFSRGWVYIYSGTGEPVDVPYQNEPALPKKLALHQNYPNPFNPTTQISFDLPTASVVSLDIYNLLGQHVAAPISNQRLSAGQHTVTWDGGDAGSGIYLYRLTTPTFQSARKMLLLK